MTSPVVEDLRAAASQLGESGVWDSYYDCVATRLGFSDYEPHELLGAVYEVLRPEHGVAALCAESAVMFGALLLTFLGVHLTRPMSFLLGALIGIGGALLLDDIFLPRAADSRMSCETLESTTLLAGLLVGVGMLAFRKGLHVALGLLFGEVAGNSAYGLLEMQSSPAGAEVQRTIRMLLAVVGAVVMLMVGDAFWLYVSAVVGSWVATRSYVELFLVNEEPRYQAFLRYEPNFATLAGHPYSFFADFIHDPYLRSPMTLFLLLAVGGGLTQREVWQKLHRRNGPPPDQQGGTAAGKPAGLAGAKPAGGYGYDQLL